MKLISEVALPDYPFRMDHRSPTLLTGSCFTENIGKMLEKYLFPVCINPFGVSYNPLSVKKGLEALLERDAYTQDDLSSYNNLWFSFDHYTGFSSPDPEKALEKINRRFVTAKKSLKSAKTLIITWGTAWVYTYNPSGQIVCNCHKIPSQQFTRSRLNVGQIVAEYKQFLPRLLKHNQDLKIILTVSPVRHWKDGAHGNQLSKSTLLLAMDALVSEYYDQLFYFPSYEIVMDELRDYRFFDRDLLHTNSLATDYIWEKFKNALLTEESLKVNSELEPLLNLMAHRPIQTEGEADEELVRLRRKKRKN